LKVETFSGYLKLHVEGENEGSRLAAVQTDRYTN
jgi:hypothetical protein